ncbi:MAG: hypothetical protein COX02_02245 [Candidatus Vogelbacteria bacterium CG22_combo_CG10-13_8_21_14_all_37_9]|uniref:DNA-directed DNA polymerase n=1 Tax=Candidatus Vogelbacteria bacterium CG22_combo_CG10-13_8_21_14_all_37_9 TaxID=1975046 RepID=A0A2H0BK53_9BACT|nr:MAG: hypothetical protein BK005_01205 [bacterium CG10_37_50]PIP58055.1 MAG: hypothetical protein COX02_02245 [Candidatus Vogelbacteria bacterium CG22_combo_CG10-13_8_21_14_all_37_9]
MAKRKFSKKLVLIDAHAIIHRAYHALPEFSSSTGEPTGGLYGLSTMLIKLISELKPDYVVACYDRPEMTFRKQAYAGYKAKRPKADEALIAQLIRSRDIFTSFNIPIYEVPGFEADDLLGTIVEQTKADEELQVVIASGDMDTLQLVAKDKVLVFTLKKGINDTITYDEKAVRERFGFGPELLPDYKGLRGDPSDNIIGITGIGEKTASDLISNFGTLEKIYLQLKKSDEAFLKAGIKPRMIELLKQGEEEAIFSKTLALIRRDAPIKFKLSDKTWLAGFNLGLVEKLFLSLEFKSLLARVKNFNQLMGGEKMEEEKSGSDALASDPVLIQETGIALWLINSELTNAGLAEILAYAGTEDFIIARTKIFQQLKTLGLEKVYQEIEQPLIPILESARERGILVDRDHLAKLAKTYRQKLEVVSQKIFDLVGHDFNLNSPKQLGEILFSELKLPLKGLRKTAGGGQSTRESELEKLADAHPIIPLILEHREWQKLLSTYLDNLPDLLDQNNRLHSTLNQAGTTTGRMSSTNPNLQNIPARGNLGPEIRNIFLASPGYTFLALDYSQIEMRVLALMSGDQDLLSIFKTGADIHTSVASRVFEVPPAEVTKDMRRQAKVINFGIIYGMGVNALRRNLGSTKAEAEKFYQQYFATFPTIKNYFDQVVVQATQVGYTETFFGRRRYFPGLKSRLSFIKAQAERMAMNAPLQGTAADIIKKAMIEAKRSLAEKKLSEQVFFLLQIHDELLYEVKTEYLTEVSTVIKQAMEKISGISMPLVVEVATGQRWGEL